jgi:ribonuclease P protein component
VPTAPLHYRRRHRLTHERQFDAVYAAKCRKTAGPLTIFALPNGLAHARLGLSVGRKIGGAVVRNTVKRRLREAFRLNQAALATDDFGLDYVINVRTHTPLTRDEYAAHLLTCADALQREWMKRGRRMVGREESP